MKKSEVKIIRIFGIIAIIVFAFSILFIGIYIKNNLDYYVTYTEKSDIDYKVFLKDNDYFKSKYLGKNTKYIASLIDHISTDFEYELAFPDADINYNYLYKIMAEVKVKDKDDDITYYEYAEELYNSKALNSENKIKIQKQLDIDYNKYNDLVSSFVNDYDLDRSTSTLKISMYVMMLDNENEYLNEIKDNKVIGLNIPLTTKTISIDINSDLQNSDSTKILVHPQENSKEFLVIGIIWMFSSLVIGAFLVIYYFKNRTPHAIYKKKIKKIMNNYGSFIQEIDNSRKIGASVVYKLKTFDDLLEVRDTIQKPILMIHNDKNTGTFFIIPANEFTIYCYAIRVIDIVASKKGLETPDYNVNNLNKETMEEKKFTKQYIDSQIDDATRTIMMQKLDAENVIRGNKNNTESIYDQLEKTSSFKIEDLKEALSESKKKTVKKSKKVSEKESNKTSSTQKKTKKETVKNK